MKKRAYFFSAAKHAKFIRKPNKLTKKFIDLKVVHMKITGI